MQQVRVGYTACGWSHFTMFLKQTLFGEILLPQTKASLAFVLNSYLCLKLCPFMVMMQIVNQGERVKLQKPTKYQLFAPSLLTSSLAAAPAPEPGDPPQVHAPNVQDASAVAIQKDRKSVV